MTRVELFKILRPIIIKVTETPECIMANQDVNSPDGEYCSIEPFGNLNQIGRGQVTEADIPAEDGSEDYYDIQETLKTLIEARVSVNFYRGDAQEQAHKLMFCDERSDVQEDLFLNGVSWMRAGQVNNLTTLNSAQYEARSQIDVYVRFIQTQTNNVQRIYSVDVTGDQIIDGVDVEIVSDSITITNEDF